jgi:hypothetical protein
VLLGYYNSLSGKKYTLRFWDSRGRVRAEFCGAKESSKTLYTIGVKGMGPIPFFRVLFSMGEKSRSGPIPFKEFYPNSIYMIRVVVSPDFSMF